MKLLIIDDDALVCASLKTILETDPQVKVVGTGGSGREAVSLYRRLRPDVLLMDIRMDGLTGLEAGELILREAPEAKILFLTTFSDDEYIIKALKLGAKGYLIKQNFESNPARPSRGGIGAKRVRQRDRHQAAGADAVG